MKKLTKKIKMAERTKVALLTLALLNVPIMILSLIFTGNLFAGGIIQLICSIVFLVQESEHHAAQNPYSWRNQPGGTHYKGR